MRSVELVLRHAPLCKVKSVETLHVRPTLRATAATTEAPAATTTAQRKAASRPSPDKKTGVKEAFSELESLSRHYRLKLQKEGGRIKYSEV